MGLQGPSGRIVLCANPTRAARTDPRASPAGRAGYFDDSRVYRVVGAGHAA